MKTSAGLGFDGESFRRIYQFKEDVPRSYINREIDRWMAQGYIDVPTNVAYRRHLAKGGKHKVRTVFVTPAAVSFAEAMFAIPLTRLFSSFDVSHPISTGFNWLAGHHRDVLGWIQPGLGASMDISEFDISAKVRQVRDMFGLIRRFFQLNEWEDKLFNLLADYQSVTLVRFGDRLVRMRGGIRSGSAFTHILGSMLNATLVLAASGLRHSLRFKVFGDDLIVRLEDASHWDDLIAGYKRFGFIVSIDKSCKDRIQWLGFDITEGRPKLLDPSKWWAGFLHPERPDSDMASHKARLAGYMISSLGDGAFLDDAFAVWHELSGVRASTNLGSVNEFIRTIVSEVKDVNDVESVMRRLWAKIC